jgi:hypothetical protein
MIVIVPDAEFAHSNPETQPDPFGPLVGQTANGCWLGYGATPFLEFGERTVEQDLKNHSSGEWSLQCGSVLWRIEQRDRVLAGSEDDRPEMEAAINAINGLVFVSGNILESTGDSILRFTDDVVLRTFVLTSEEDARWSLRHGDAAWLTLGPSVTTPSESSITVEANAD